MKARGFRSWIRRAYVPDAFLWTCVALIPLLSIVDLVLPPLSVWVARRMAPNLADEELYLPQIVPIHNVVLLVVAFAIGVFRAYSCHPLLRKQYGTWLAQTPWRPTQDLPFGPLRLMTQDLLVVAILTAAWLLPPRADWHPLYVPIAFLGGYCAVWLLNLERFWSYPLDSTALILIGIGVGVCESPYVLLLVALALYVVVRLKITYTLRDFPYTESRRQALGLVPFDVLPPVQIEMPISPRDFNARVPSVNRGQAVLIGGLVAGAFLVGGYLNDAPDLQSGMLCVHGLMSAVLIFSRLVLYCRRALPPLSLLARLATHRLIVPGYDRVFVVPLVTAVVAYLLPHLLLWCGLAPLVAISLSAGVAAALIFGLPPDLDNWNYTGHFRIPANYASRVNFVRS